MRWRVWVKDDSHFRCLVGVTLSPLMIGTLGNSTKGSHASNPTVWLSIDQTPFFEKPFFIQISSKVSNGPVVHRLQIPLLRLIQTFLINLWLFYRSEFQTPLSMVLMHDFKSFLNSSFNSYIVLWLIQCWIFSDNDGRKPRQNLHQNWPTCNWSSSSICAIT